MRNKNCVFTLLTCYLLFLLKICSAYETPSNEHQYHIQTDEGPERYFRYQTLSGQYRKEKRLEDGTVIGTYAWIDEDGMLRQRDYIADSGGYRITKSKNLYVGRNVPVGDAVKATKKYSAHAGTLLSSKNRPPYNPIIAHHQAVDVTTQRPIISSSTPSSTPCASCIIQPTTYKPDLISNFLSSTISSPQVEISNNAFPASSTSLPFISSTENPFVEITSSSPSSSAGILSSTGLPLEYLKSNPQAINNLQYQDIASTPTKPLLQYEGLPSYPEADQNSLEHQYNPYINSLNKDIHFQNGPTYPIDRNGHTYRGRKRYSQPRIGDGYQKQYPEYDGVSVTNDGFRYYIPRAYHEEETEPGNEKTGSFGYIDPFGIRRVIYYNAKPGQGFLHRKNNRYVGFHATPYDPQPY